MAVKNTYPGTQEALSELAYNLYFSWNPDVRDLYKYMDNDLWRSCGRNPVAFLKQVPSDAYKAAIENPEFDTKVRAAYTRFQQYMNQKETRFNKAYPDLSGQLIAYFSAEYGVHESLPNYAGGLGILAGDHCKTASDLGLPFVAVGLMYKHAYFSQEIDADGNQREIYEKIDSSALPVSLVKDENDKPVYTEVQILNRTVLLQIWKAQVGRIELFLLDSNVEQNDPEDRDIINSLYGGSRDTRIRQEIILGIGGLRALEKMGYKPTVFHMNEGHSAFLGLERLAQYIDDGMSLNSALEMVRSTSLFTTHTPIPAGNEAFEIGMIESYFSDFWPRLGMTRNQFIALGLNKNIHEHENFSLTILALNLSYMANGVSKLHGEVSRKMWQKVFPGIPTEEVPIGHVTNGVHTESWLHRKMIALFDQYLGKDWRNHIQDAAYWNRILDIPDEVYWNTMQELKQEMSAHLRKRYGERLNRYQGIEHGYPAPEEVINDQIFTIGFARRFAPYKRATLMFRDPERLKRILNHPERPVQILFAGKAHPHNDAGKELIRTINQFSREPGFRGKIVFIEGYTINVSRSLVSGVDLWLNNPRRPLEASGTSGQKVPINGGVNFSVLDGWWPEGFNGKNGWCIGDETEHPDHNQQDAIDADSFYETLENEIVPAWYERNARGIPEKWVQISKESLRSLFTQFSTHTMVWNYAKQYYVPGMRRSAKYCADEGAQLFKFTRWKNRMVRHWKSLHLQPVGGASLSEDERIFSAGEEREISVQVYVDGLKPEELRVELILERQDAIHGHQQMEIYPMGIVGKLGENTFEYRVKAKARANGSYRFNCRLLPTHPDLFNRHETRLIRWLD